jgi:hypothetical protein
VAGDEAATVTTRTRAATEAVSDVLYCLADLGEALGSCNGVSTTERDDIVECMNEVSQGVVDVLGVLGSLPVWEERSSA